MLTDDRLQSYLSATNRNVDAALDLYVWNANVAGALIATIGQVEVIVRNAIDQQMLNWARARGESDWFDVAPLDANGLIDIFKAKRRATSFGKQPLVRGKVIAELPFGFWRFLVAGRYHASLWVPSLHIAFSNGAPNIRYRRAEVERILTNLNFVRNRAAHHEPIHKRNLAKDLQAALTITSWVSADAAAWIGATTTLLSHIESKPSKLIRY